MSSTQQRLDMPLSRAFFIDRMGVGETAPGAWEIVSSRVRDAKEAIRKYGTQATLAIGEVGTDQFKGFVTPCVLCKDMRSIGHLPDAMSMIEVIQSALAPLCRIEYVEPNDAAYPESLRSGFVVVNTAMINSSPMERLLSNQEILEMLDRVLRDLAPPSEDQADIAS